MAREVVPHVISITIRELPNVDIKDRAVINVMLDLLDGFNGEMSEDSVAATVYSYW